MSLLNKEPVKRAEKALKQFNQTLSVTELENTARTAIDAAASLNCEVGAIVKSLLFKNGDNYFLCLVSGDKRCSLNKLKKFFNSKDLSMASPDEVKDQTGYTIGGVSPIGHINSLQILVDSSLNRFKDLYAAAGHPNCIFKINFVDLLKLTNGSLEDIVE
jgi:Cys-tRNA(Pro) deacylase